MTFQNLLPSLWQLNIELSLLLALVLIARAFVRQSTKTYNAYLLWAVIPLGLLVTYVARNVQFTAPPVPSVSNFVQSYVVKPSHSAPDWTALFWLWGIVAALLLLRLAWQHMKLRRQLVSITAPLTQILESRYPIVGIDKEDFSPAVYGFLRPKIYFPVHLEKELSVAQRNLILRHEEHHITQRHLWLNLFWDILVCCFWFNPLMYLSRQRFRHDQELYCDYLVLNKSQPADPISYGHALLTTVSATHSVSLLCSWKAFNQIEERIMNIKKPNSRTSKILLGISGLLIVVSTSLYGVNAGQYSEGQKGSQFSFHHEESDNGDRRIEWIEDGHHFLQDNDQYFAIVNGVKRPLTEQERAKFEREIERSQERIRAREEQRARSLEEAHREREARLEELTERSKEKEMMAKEAQALRQQQMEIAEQSLLARRESLKNVEPSNDLSRRAIAEAERDIAAIERKLERDRQRLERERQRMESERLRLEKEAQRIRDRMRHLEEKQTGVIPVPSSDFAALGDIPLPPSPPAPPEPPLAPSPPIAPLPPEPPLAPEPPLPPQSLTYGYSTKDSEQTLEFGYSSDDSPPVRPSEEKSPVNNFDTSRVH